MKRIKSNNCLCSKNNKKNYLNFRLNNLPLTETYSRKYKKNYYKANQVFKYCDICKHGFLANIIDPKTLYNNVYYFRTSKAKHLQLDLIFLKFLNTNLKKKKYIFRYRL